MENAIDCTNSEDIMTTMQDVAKKARVSITTVSRVLNGDARVKADTRSRVERVMASMGYQPNLMARALRQQSSRVIGLVVDTLKNPFTAELSQGVADHLDATGYQLILADTQRQSQKGPRLLQMLAQRGVDGILYAAGWETDADSLTVECRIIQRNQIPTVIVGNALPTVTSVSIDHRQGIRDALTHLYGLGHRHVAFVSGAGETETTRLRRQGFVDTAKALGLRMNSVYASHGSLRAATTVVDTILQNAPGTTAIVAASDYIAVGILHGLFTKAYQVPRDISVIGFDNVQISQFLCPALTTIDADIPQLASAACERLYSLITDPALSVDPLVLVPQLVRRQSTGVPRSRDAGPDNKRVD